MEGSIAARKHLGDTAPNQLRAAIRYVRSQMMVRENRAAPCRSGFSRERAYKVIKESESITVHSGLKPLLHLFILLKYTNKKSGDNFHYHRFFYAYNLNYKLELIACSNM